MYELFNGSYHNYSDFRIKLFSTTLDTELLEASTPKKYLLNVKKKSVANKNIVVSNYLHRFILTIPIN